MSEPTEAIMHLIREQRQDSRNGLVFSYDQVENGIKAYFATHSTAVRPPVSGADPGGAVGCERCCSLGTTRGWAGVRYHCDHCNGTGKITVTVSDKGEG